MISAMRENDCGNETHNANLREEIGKSRRPAQTIHPGTTGAGERDSEEIGTTASERGLHYQEIIIKLRRHAQYSGPAFDAVDHITDHPRLRSHGLASTGEKFIGDIASPGDYFGQQCWSIREFVRAIAEL
jgi:hypothetical protein